MTDSEKLIEIRCVVGQVEQCTQADFAEMIGTTRSTIARMESGIRPVTANMKRKIQEELGAEFLNEYEYPVSYSYGTGKYERFTKETYKTYKFLKTATLSSSESKKRSLKPIILLEFAIADMDETICGCNHFLAIKRKSDSLRRILKTGILVSYARPFIENKNMSKISSEFEKFADENAKQWHDYFIEKRNKIYADWDFGAEASAAKEQGINEIGYITFNPNGKLDTHFERITEPYENEFINAVKLVAEFQKDRMKKTANKIYDDFIKTQKYRFGTYSVGFDGEIRFKN